MEEMEMKLTEFGDEVDIVEHACKLCKVMTLEHPKTSAFILLGCVVAGVAKFGMESFKKDDGTYVAIEEVTEMIEKSCEFLREACEEGEEDD